MKAPIEELEKKIEYEFRDKSLLALALTHSSYANEKKKGEAPNNERLEFLGDAVLELVSSEEIFFKHKDMREGKMTKLRAKLVCEPSLAEFAKRIDLSTYIRLGYGEEKTGGRNRASIVSDCMEALIGAIYVDAGLEPARRFIKKHILFDIENTKYFTDNKTAIQEVLQAKGETPVYEVIKEEGPSHDRIFTAIVKSGEVILGEGCAKSKKAAEQEAAGVALKKLQNNK